MAVTFMDLPVEIRTDIYGYVLEEEQAIRLRIQVHKKRNGPREIVRPGHNRDPRHRGQVRVKPGSFKWMPRPYTHSSLLLVSRQINSEATPALFGNNIFLLETTTAIKDFVELIGNNRARHLRYIRVAEAGYKSTTVRGALKALTAAKGLRMLAFHSNEVSRWYRPLSPAQLAADCKQLMKTLQKSYKELNLAGSVPHVLQFWNTNQDWLSDGWQERTARAEKEVRNVIATDLGLASRTDKDA